MFIMLDMGMIIVVLIPFYLETKAKDAPSLVHLLLNIKHWAPKKDNCPRMEDYLYLLKVETVIMYHFVSIFTTHYIFNKIITEVTYTSHRLNSCGTVELAFPP